MQQAALAKTDLLPLYGGSEVTAEDTPYTAYKFFKTYPTGFTVFDVAQPGASFLTLAQDFAALGPDLRGKKVVISFTPSTFNSYDINEEAYRGNFSRLHANALVFSPYLTMNLKQAAARRMLEFSQTTENDPLLKYGLINLAGNSFLNQCLYYFSWPLGMLQTTLIRLQDHEIVLSFLLTDAGMVQDVKHDAAIINWGAVLYSARREQLSRTLNNPYGVDALVWSNYQDQHIIPVPAGTKDQRFIQTLAAAKEWDDFELVLGILKEMGAEPLIMSRPMNVGLWEAFGVTRQVQGTYYSKLHSVVDPYRFRLVDFHTQDDDLYFSVDGASHSSRAGWVYVDQVLNRFYQGLLP